MRWAVLRPWALGLWFTCLAAGSFAQAPKAKPSPKPAASPEAKKAVQPPGKPAKKVFTNEDLPPPPKEDEAGQQQEAPPEQPAAGEETGGIVRPSDESSWRDRARSAYAGIRAFEKQVRSLEEKLKALNLDMQAAPEDAMDPFRLQRRDAKKQELTKELEDVKTQLDMARKDLAELEDEARRKGVPPGWIREPE